MPLQFIMTYVFSEIKKARNQARAKPIMVISRSDAHQQQSVYNLVGHGKAGCARLTKYSDAFSVKREMQVVGPVSVSAA